MTGHRIILETAEKPRYADTCGDWWTARSGDVHIVVTKLDVLDDEGFLIALHELVEWKLCQKRGITQKFVDDFDMAFKGEGEPGDDPAAPYREQHRQAMIVEHLVANFLGMTSYGEVR